MVAAEDRHPHRPGDQRRGDARRTGGAEVDEVVAPVGERLDDRRQAGDTDLQARVERDVDLGNGAQPPVDVVVGADDLDLEAGHAAVAQLVERVRHAVHAADGVGDERDAQRLALAAGELGLLATEEGRGRGVRDRREARVEQRGRRAVRDPARRAGPRRPPRRPARACARARAWRGDRGRRGRSRRAAGGRAARPPPCRARPPTARRAAAHARRRRTGRCRRGSSARRPRA